MDEWSVVTGFFSSSDLDETIYKVQVRNGDPLNVEHVAAVSKLLGKAFYVARDLFQAEDRTVFTGRAPQVIELLKTLGAVGLECDIDPPFPHAK